MALKSVLILTAGFGEGHNAAARNLHESLRAASPGTQVVVSDVFLEAYGAFNRLTQRAYLATINHAPAVWQAVFHLLDRTPLVEWHIGLYRAAARRLEQILTELRPDVVVSTYPGCNHLLDFVCRKRLRRPFRTVTIITDSLTINAVWHRAFSDDFIVANPGTADVLHRAGVPETKIRVMGFPVPRIFATQNVPRPVPPPGGIWNVLYIINSGRLMAPAVVRELLKLESIRLTVTVGRDETLGRRIHHEAAGRPLTVLGWTPDMPRLMAENHLLISKAGGATVQETLAARTPMIITQIVPGQEEGNARLVLENGAGALATTPAGIARDAGSAFENEGELWQAWHHAATALGRSKAADAIAGYLLRL